jgi:hypothetical protein
VHIGSDIAGIYTVKTSGIDGSNVYVDVVETLPDTGSDFIDFSIFYEANITVEDVTEIAGTQYDNWCRYSKAGGYSFPPANLIKINEPIIRCKPSPSFLQFTYGNTVLIWTRNGVYRIVLDSSGSAQGSNSLIPEIKSKGLLHPDTLVQSGGSVMWLSESGVIKWDSSGVRQVSLGVISSNQIFNVIDIPLTARQYRAYYIALRNQYLLQGNDRFNGVDSVGGGGRNEMPDCECGYSTWTKTP